MSALPQVWTVIIPRDLPQQVQQLRHVGRDVPRLVLEQLGSPRLPEIAPYPDISQAGPKRRDWTHIGSGAFMSAHRAVLARLAAEYQLPAMYGHNLYTEAGGLMSYGPSIPDLFRRAAAYVDKILKGANPADLPVQQPVKFDLVINLKTAKALGLDIPPTVLARVDEVIE